MKNLLSAILVVFLCGCVTPAQLEARRTPERAAAMTTVEYDTFQKMSKYKGPDFYHGLFGGNTFIRSWKRDGLPITHQIYVKAVFSSWAFLHSAYDSNGNKLDVVPISRDIGSCKNGCTLYEHVGINVTTEYLASHAETGLAFKVIGKSDERVLHLPASYIKGYLSVAQ